MMFFLIVLKIQKSIYSIYYIYSKNGRCSEDKMH